MKTTLDILTAARVLLTPEGAWRCGWLAYDASGTKVYVQSPDATSFSVVGAILASSPDVSVQNQCVDAIRHAGALFSIGDWERVHTHAEVLALLDRAIEAQKAIAAATAASGPAMDGDLKFPCDYCGTLLNEDGEERSDIAACGPRHAHSAYSCRQIVGVRLEYARERLARAEAALKAIAESPHCQYSSDGTSYRDGVVDGHRCAARTARAYFEAESAAASGKEKA